MEDFTQGDLFPLTLNEYQASAYKTCMPTAYEFDYLITNLAGEAGEVASKYAKHLRDSTAFPRVEIAKECGDVLWQVAVLAQRMGYTLEEIARINLRKLQDRRDRGVLTGQGDNR